MERIETLVKKLDSQQSDSALITSTANFYYLSQYYTEPHERVIALYITKDFDPIMVLPEMEVDDAKMSGWDFPIIGYRDHENPWQLLRQHLTKKYVLPNAMAIEYNHITLERSERLKTFFPQTELLDLENMLTDIRVIKSKKEYTLLKQAAQIADHAIQTGINSLQKGITELEVIAAIEYEMKKQGVHRMSFATMCLSGDKTASPHGKPGERKITAGDLIMLDLGVVFEGYCSDITRTIAYQSITNEQEKMYQIVLEANRKGIETSTIGTPIGQVDASAREIIELAGYGKYFNHRIGHGIGIETHEYPSMSSDNQLKLQKGMSFTIEPGIYTPGIGGIRIEDMLFMTERGPEILTTSPKEIQIID